MKVTSDEIFERALIRANRAMWAIDLQVRRLRGQEPADGDFLEREADFEFLVVATSRLRRAAYLAQSVPETKKQITRAVRLFDTRLPGLKKLRDIAEHIDEYSVDRGKDSSVPRRYLENRMFTNSGQTWTWLGASINTEDALGAANELYCAIKAARDTLTNQAMYLSRGSAAS